MTPAKQGTPKLRILPPEEIARRHQLTMSHLSPWDRSSSDPTLSPAAPAAPTRTEAEPGAHLITGSRHSRRPMPPQSQFRSSLAPSGDLEFRPEYREAYYAYPSDACVSPRHARRRRRRSSTAIEGGVRRLDGEGGDTAAAAKVEEVVIGEGGIVKLEVEQQQQEVEEETGRASVLGTEDRGATQNQLEGEQHAGSTAEELPCHSTAVYQRRKSSPVNLLLHHNHQDENENYLSYDTETRSQYVTPSLEDRVHLLRRATTLHLYGEQYFNPEYKSSYIDLPRKRFIKPSIPRSNLHCEGEFNCETEVHSKYIPYNIVLKQRSELIRHHTQLLIEGDMNISPEYRASYIEYPRQRPVVMPRPRANLQLAGPESIMGVSEQREKFSNVPLSPRPSLIRRPSTLHIGSDDVSEEVREVMRRPRPATVHANFASPSGDHDARPEYRDSFRDFPRHRPEFSRPAGTLNIEGPWLGRSPEYRAAFTDFPRQRPEVKKQNDSLKLFGGLNDKETQRDFTRKRPQGKKPIENIKPEGELMATSPEYKEKFKNFPRQRPDIKKATETLKPEGKFSDQSAEYKENYKDSPRMRPKVVKPSGNIQSEAEMVDQSTSNKTPYNEYPPQKPIIKKTTDNKSPEYIEEFKDFPRQRNRITPSENSRPEGEILDNNGEYRNSYVNFPRQRPDMTRPEGNLRSDGAWLGRFPEYRAAFIDLPRSRPVLLRPPGGLVDPDTLGGGYAPTFDGTSRSDLLRPSSAGSPRSRSPAGISTGGPKHNKRSCSHVPRSPRRPVSRAGHLDEAFPPSYHVDHAPSLLVSQPSVDSVNSFRADPARAKEVPSDRQVKFALPQPLSTRNNRSSPPQPSSPLPSAFKVLDATEPSQPLDFRAAKGRAGTGEGKWGTGWLTNP